MATARKTAKAPAKRAASGAAARKPSATTKRAAKPAAKKESTSPARAARTAVDEMVVQADLATMDARDQWNRLMSDVERRRVRLETATKRLAAGGADATRTMNDAIREAMTELRDAVESALAALR